MTALEGRQVGCPSHDGRACRVPVGATTAALLPVLVHATLLLWLQVRGGKERVGVYVLCVRVMHRPRTCRDAMVDRPVVKYVGMPAPAPPFARAHTHSLTGEAMTYPFLLTRPGTSARAWHGKVRARHGQVK
jgi:hypothetical protein